MKLNGKMERDILDCVNDIINKVYIETNFPKLPIVACIQDYLSKVDVRSSMFVELFDIQYIVLIDYSVYGRAVFLDSCGYEVLVINFENDDKSNAWLD